MKTLVITYNNQAGLACGYAAWNKLRLSAEYVSLDYGQDLPNLDGVDMLYILGYSLTIKQLEDLSNRNIAILIVDDKNIKIYNEFIDSDGNVKTDTGDNHEMKRHITVGTNIKSSNNENDEPISINNSIEFIIDTTKSSIRSCWEYFNPGYDLPKVLKYIEDRHLWKFKYNESRNLYYGLISQNVNNNYNWWLALCTSDSLLNFVLQKGVTISEYIDVTNRQFVLNEDNFIYRYLNNNKVVIFSYTTDVSELSKEIFKLKEDVDIVIGLKLISSERTRCELRSRENTIDVGELARMFGGGGKTNTAGIILSHDDLYHDFFDLFELENK